MKIKKERSHSNNFRGVLKEYFSFYNKNLRRKHIVIYILSLIVFTMLMIVLIQNLDEINQITAGENIIKSHSNIFMTILTEKIPLTFLIVFSGLAPFAYIPLIGIFAYPYILVIQLINMSVINMVLACIGSVIQIFGISLAISAGIYYCKLSSKRYRYNESATFGLDDVKLQFYESTKRIEKLDKLKNKIEVKREKKEKLNVKIEYKNLMITAIISTIIVVVAALITGV